MNVKFLSVTPTYRTRLPRVYLCGTWLTQMGFMPGVLIQALPEPGGMVFRVCDENIQKYSDLVKDTQAKGGKLIQVCCEQGLTLATSGQYIRTAGLGVGDACIVQYDYGIIRVRKLPPQTKIITTKKTNPKTRMLCGNILTMNGFLPGSLAAVSSEPGKIAFFLQDQGIEHYREMMKYARANQMNLMQVVNAAGVIRIRIPDLCLHKAGFALNESILVHYDYGSIILKKLDLNALGF